MQQAINKDNISNQTRINRKKAIEIILFGGNTENKSINNIINSVSQQNIEMSELRSKLMKSTIAIYEIYEYLNSHKKGIIPVLIAFLIKDNINYMVAHRGLEEINISSDLLNIELESNNSIELTIINDKEIYDDYTNLFYSDNQNMNIFSNILEGMYVWLFNLDSYTLNSKKEYLSNGKYTPISQTIVDFKESLKSIQKNPYYYLSYVLPKILGKEYMKELCKIKEVIDSNLSRLKTKITKDIKSVFPETVDKWYDNLPDSSRCKIYKGNEENFLFICSKKYNDEMFLEKITKLLTGMPIQNWNDDVPAMFYNRLLNVRNVIETIGSEGVKTGFIINYIENGQEKLKKFLDMSFDIDSQVESNIINEIKSILNDYNNYINNSAKVAIAIKLVLEGDKNDIS